MWKHVKEMRIRPHSPLLRPPKRRFRPLPPREQMALRKLPPMCNIISLAHSLRSDGGPTRRPIRFLLLLKGPKVSESVWRPLHQRLAGETILLFAPSSYFAVYLPTTLRCVCSDGYQDTYRQKLGDPNPFKTSHASFEIRCYRIGFCRAD